MGVIHTAQRKLKNDEAVKHVPGIEQQQPVEPRSGSNKKTLAAAIALLAFSAFLIIGMETGILEDGFFSNFTTSTTTSITKTTVTTITTTEINVTTTTVSTPPPTTINACGVILDEFITDKYTYSHETDNQINCQLMVSNPSDSHFNPPSIIINIDQTKTQGVGAPNVQQFLRTDDTIGQLSIAPGNSTYLNFSFINPLFESTIGEYMLEMVITIDGVPCLETLTTDYRVI